MTETVPLVGLTVRGGLNGSDKSSVIQSIRTMYQWWEDLQEGPNPW